MPDYREVTIDLMRHGECEGGDVYRGSTDLPLSPVGWQQMKDAVAGDNPWQKIISSPLSRCLEFSRLLVDEAGLELEVLDDLREIHFGDWEGRSMDEVWKEEGGHVRKFFANPEDSAPPNGEPMKVFAQRVVHAWNSMVHQQQYDRLLVVAHGGVVRIILAHVLGMPLANMSRLQVPYASISRVSVYHLEDSVFPVVHSVNKA
jgi:alpha-ribazole phosphatase